MTGDTPPFDPLYVRPLVSDDARKRRLAKKVGKVTQRPPPEEPGAAGERDAAIGGCECPSCGCPVSQVIATRPTILRKIWRRRECFHCGHKFSTVERVIRDRPKRAD